MFVKDAMVSVDETVECVRALGGELRVLLLEEANTVGVVIHCDCVFGAEGLFEDFDCEGGGVRGEGVAAWLRAGRDPDVDPESLGGGRLVREANGEQRVGIVVLMALKVRLHGEGGGDAKRFTRIMLKDQMSGGVTAAGGLERGDGSGGAVGRDYGSGGIGAGVFREEVEFGGGEREGEEDEPQEAL